MQDSLKSGNKDSLFVQMNWRTAPPAADVRYLSPENRAAKRNASNVYFNNLFCTFYVKQEDWIQIYGNKERTVCKVTFVNVLFCKKALRINLSTCFTIIQKTSVCAADLNRVKTVIQWGVPTADWRMANGDCPARSLHQLKVPSTTKFQLRVAQHHGLLWFSGASLRSNKFYSRSLHCFLRAIYYLLTSFFSLTSVLNVSYIDEKIKQIWNCSRAKLL